MVPVTPCRRVPAPAPQQCPKGVIRINAAGWWSPKTSAVPNYGPRAFRRAGTPQQKRGWKHSSQPTPHFAYLMRSLFSTFCLRFNMCAIVAFPHISVRTPCCCIYNHGRYIPESVLKIEIIAQISVLQLIASK